jgi:hypothetical protein
MKVNTFKKIEEGFFSNVYNQSFTGMSDNPKRDQKEISKRAAPLFISDFIKDLNADLTSALTNKAITITATPTPTTESSWYEKINSLVESYISEAPIPTGFTPDKIEKIRPSIDRAIAAGKIKNATDLGAELAKKYPNTWKNTVNKKEVLDSLIPPAPAPTPAPTPTPTGFTPDKIEKIRPSIDRAIAAGKIKNATDLGAELAKKYPNTWKNTVNKKEVLDSLIPPAPTPTPAQTETMEQYIVRWFDAYMQGVEWKEYEPKVTEFAKEIANSYEKDKGKSGIQQLANIAWEATSKGREIPIGARNVPNMYTSASGGKLSDKEFADLIQKVKRGGSSGLDSEKQLASYKGTLSDKEFADLIQKVKQGGREGANAEAQLTSLYTQGSR